MTKGNKETFHYYTNGLNINSEIPFPELSKGIGVSNINVDVRLGIVPLDLNNIISELPHRQISATDFLLKIDGVANYFVKGCNEVIIQPLGSGDLDSIRVYFLSTIMGVLLWRNNICPLHASTVVVQDKVILIAGRSGAGKSTTALGLHQRGYTILNDDISSIYFDDHQNPFVFPGYSHLKLWSQSLNSFGYDTNNYRLLKSNLEKFSFPLKQEIKLDQYPLAAIFFLDTGKNDFFTKEPVSGLKLFDYLKINTFRYKLAQHLGKNVLHFRACSILAKKVQFQYITRPENCEPNSLIDYVEDLIKKV